MDGARLEEFDQNLTVFKQFQGQLEINNIADIEFPKPQCLYFAKTKKYLEDLIKTDSTLQSSSVCIIADNIEPLENSFAAVYQSSNFDISVCTWSEKFYLQRFCVEDYLVDGRENQTAKIHPNASIAPGAFIGAHSKVAAGAIIHANAVVMAHSSIGERSEIFPGVTIYSNVHIGQRCRIHASSVIGSDGFGYNYHAGQHHKIWHLGGVHIGNDVEIGACSMVDSGTFSPTIIDDGCKFDNHVQIAHNCQVGKGVIICGQAGLSGSNKMGDYTVMAGKAGTAQGIVIGKQCKIAGGALINCNWPDKSEIAGHPARPLKEWLRGVAYLRKMSLNKKGK